MGNVMGGAQALAILKKIEDQQNEIELLKNKNVQLQNEIDEKKIYRYGITEEARNGNNFSIKTNLKCNYAWFAYGALCLLVARDVDGGYLETIDNLIYYSNQNIPTKFDIKNISQSKYREMSASYSISDDGYLLVSISTEARFFTNFSMCLIPF